MTSIDITSITSNAEQRHDMAATSDRLYFLDWVRIFAFCLLIFYHVGMYYVTWYWHIKSDVASSTIEPLMFLTNPWRMSLLFLISGVATRFMLGKQKPRNFVSSRSWRILLPLFFGMAVIVPPQAYLEVVQRLAYVGSYADFLNLYFHNYRGFVIEGKRLVLPTWNHLWFLPYLWVYSILIAAFAAYAPSLIAQLEAWIAKHFRGVWVTILPVAYLALIRINLLSEHPPTNNLTNDWYNHANYLFFFVSGFLLATQTRFWEELAQRRWRSLILALCGWVFLISYFSYYNDNHEAPKAMLYFQRLMWTLMAWNAILALCGFARQYWNCDHPLREYLTQAVFPFYIVHQTLIIVLAWNMKSWHLPPLVEGGLLVVLTFGFCWLGFELIRRVRWLRPLFGMPSNHQSRIRLVAH